MPESNNQSEKEESDGVSCGKQYKKKKKEILPPPFSGSTYTNLQQSNPLFHNFPTSHGKGAPGGIGRTVQRTADRLVLHGNDVTNRKEFFEKISNSLNGVRLYYNEGEEMGKYDTLHMQPLKQVPSMREIGQVTPHQSNVLYRHYHAFAVIYLRMFFLGFFSICMETDSRARKKGPLAMLMEQMEMEEMEELI